MRRAREGVAHESMHAQAVRRVAIDRRPDPLAGPSEAQAQPAADPHVAELRHQRLLARERLEELQLGTFSEPFNDDAVDVLAKEQHVFAQ